jgi:predicted dehydrogenase
MLLGEPRALTGQAVLTPRGIDDAAALVLTYDSGAIATVTCAQNALTDSTATVAGDRGRIEVAAPVMAPPSLRVVAAEDDGADDGADEGADEGAEEGAGEGAGSEVVAEPMIGVGMAHEAIEVQRCLRAGLPESPLVPLDETLLVARLLDRARQVCGVRLPGDG